MKIKLLSVAALLFTSVVTFSQKSAATLRLEGYGSALSCPGPTIPTTNPDWNLEFEVSNLTGDLAPNDYYTRRDPSSVLKVNGKYYVWYSYSLSNGAGKISPWDLNDLYYATSLDGFNWTEQGAAITRGPAGSYDHRSAFTTEVFYHDNMFYLIYQASDTQANLNTNNTIAMAYSSSPDGPWTKLDNPVLYPSYQDGAFDRNAVHDPCIIYYNNKFYMYFKGEGGQANNVCSAGTGIWGDYDKQVKWGVAVADNVTGPYVKSASNPVTNTGHEVCVWNSGNGVGIMLHQDGPEYGTTQYASDGINFEIMGQVDFPLKEPWNSTYPEAPGLYRPVTDDTSPVTGVSWGLSHVLNWTGTYGQWMYIRRFENKDKTAIVDDSGNQGIVTSPLSTNSSENIDIKLYPNPVTDKLTISGFDRGDLSVFDITGALVLSTKIEANNSVIDLSQLANGLYVLNFVDGNKTQTIRIIKE